MVRPDHATISLLLVLISIQGTISQEVYYMTPLREIVGSDLACDIPSKDAKGLDKECYMCGGLATVAALCSKMPDCKGFTMSTEDCGTLKTQADRTVQGFSQGGISFCKARLKAETTCTGPYVVMLATDVPGEDLDCGRKEDGKKVTYCREYGNPLQVMYACDKNSNCGGFTINARDNGKFGLMKKNVLNPSSRTTATGVLTFMKSEMHPNRRLGNH